MAEIVTRTREQAFDHWIAALESGEFKRGQFRLRYVSHGGPTLFCCLGVACELARRDGGSEWEYDGSYLKHAATFSDQMLSFFGMTSDEQSDLIEMNDLGGTTFSEIANYIRTEIKPKALTRDYDTAAAS